MSSLMISLGAPDFYLTLNPCDVHSALLCRLAGRDIQLFPDGGLFKKLPGAAARTVLVAAHPYEAAVFSYKVITAFCKALLGTSSTPQRPVGVFGPVRGHYFAVEEQGRGSLHFHGVCWLANKPDPATFERLLLHDKAFQERLLTYLEAMIECEEPAVKNCEYVVHSVDP